MRMWKNKAKRLWKTGIAILLFSLALLLPVSVSAAKTDTDAVLQLEKDIVNWKLSVTGQKQMLEGDLLDGAGGAGSDWFAFDVARMGETENRAAYLSRLKDATERIYANLEDAKVKLRLSDLHRVAMTVEALGGDPTAFGTDTEGNTIDLINDTVWNSIWGDPGDQGINGYIWALLTVDSGKYEEPENAEWTREKIISEILSRQLADGGFGLIKTDPSDVDLTSMTLTALAPYQGDTTTYTVTNIVTDKEETLTVDDVAEKAFDCLSKLQKDDGSMLTYDERTSESTSWALMALASWGKDPDEDEAFIKDGHTLLDGIREFRLADGGIIHSLDGDQEETTGNNMAGYQALYGLEAVYRLRENKNRVFDLTDVTSKVSDEEIEAAGQSLPELTETPEKTQEEIETDTENRVVYLTAGIAAVIVVVVILFLVLLSRDSKKKKAVEKKAQEEDDDDDEW